MSSGKKGGGIPIVGDTIGDLANGMTTMVDDLSHFGHNSNNGAEMPAPPPVPKDAGDGGIEPNVIQNPDAWRAWRDRQVPAAAKHQQLVSSISSIIDARKRTPGMSAATPGRVASLTANSGASSFKLLTES